MKYLLIGLSLFFYSILTVSCNKVEYGEATGNVYYKYNDFVGHKPDVGASVEYWAKDTTAEISVYRTTTDVNGDFNLPKIITGEYFVVIKSAKQRSCPRDALNNIVDNKDQLKNIFEFDVEKEKFVNNFISLKKEIDILWDKKLNKEYTGQPEDFLLNIERLEFRQDSIATVILTNISSLNKMILNTAGPYSNKIKYNNVKINKDSENKINIDFDITCL